MENVTVPAGTFSARHLVFGSGSGASEPFLSTQVPGAVVKTAHSSSAQEVLASGDGAKSELGWF